MGIRWLAGVWLGCTATAFTAEITPIEPDGKAGRSLAVAISGGALVHTGQVLPAGPADVPTPPADQVRQAFSRLDEVLKPASSGLAQIVKLNVYVSHPSITPLVDAELAA